MKVAVFCQKCGFTAPAPSARAGGSRPVPKRCPNRHGPLKKQLGNVRRGKNGTR